MREHAAAQTFTLDESTLVARLPWQRAVKRPQHVCFEAYRDGAWRGVTEAELLKDVTAIAKGLVAGGVRPGDRVALMAATRVEWVVLDLAIWNAGGVTVPIYPSSSSSQVQWIVEDSQARLLLVETPDHRRVASAADLGDVEVLMIDDGALDELARRGKGVSDDEIRSRVDALTLDDIASVIYTSGTTGRPKGCVMTHRNLAGEAQGLLVHPAGSHAVFGVRMLMFLPMAHVFARAMVYTGYSGGATVGFWSDFSTIAERFASFQPNLILGVPRVFEKVHASARQQAEAKGSLTAGIFARADKVAVAWSRAVVDDGRPAPRRSPRLRAQHALYDRLVYRKVREAFGGECLFAISGGGALGEHLGHFFRGVGVPVYEGYGLTETCAAIAGNGPGQHRIGTVGPPLSGNAVRIAEDGEVEVRGVLVCAGYWHADEATAEAFDGEWFRTGDLGELGDDGYLRITGRKKEVIVTAGGKNVAPGPLEEALRGHTLIGNAMVLGDGRSFISALVTLDPEGASAWARDNGRDDDLEALAKDSLVRSTIQSAVDEANQQVSQAESIRRFAVLAQDFTEESGELTATLKVRRHVVADQHADEIDELYRRR